MVSKTNQQQDKGLVLAERVHPKYRPVFERLSEADRAAVALYFLPHGSKKQVLEVTRPHIVKWYCPFADQREFPSGHRYYSINVYAGCEHRCEYCYAAGMRLSRSRARRIWFRRREVVQLGQGSRHRRIDSARKIASSTLSRHLPTSSARNRSTK
jgi:radical SAM superfamily enzyme YgiQ (UPF0313 family)